ncbi:MAG TPA: T9SS type A sorting domain-containing protein [Ignavibacteria bacterium]|nr:T9SS type A sorting domain-containing protein [Ignavibacteria bacterium]
MRAGLIILFSLFLTNICFSQWIDVSTGINGGNPSFIGSNGTYLFTSAYNKIYRSSNNGDSWQLLNTQHLNIRQFVGFESIGSTIFLSFRNDDSITCYKSINQGETWIPANQGLLNSNVRNLIKSGNTLILYSQSNNTIYRSTNLGNSWQGLFFNKLFDMYCMGANSSTILASVPFNLFKSTNNGDNWTSIDNTSPPFVILTANENYFFGRRLNGHNYYSSNQGTNWIQMPDASLGSFLKLYIFNDVFYAITESGIVRSTNFGQTWNNIYNNIDATNITVFNNNIFSTNVIRGIFSTNINNINWIEKNNGIQAENLSVITSDDNDNLYAAQKYGDCIYVTETKLHQWTKKYPPVQGRIITIHAASNGLYLGTEDGLYKSINAGTSWTLVPSFADKYVSNIISSGDSIYLGVLSDGIYFSSNGGTSWQLRNNGITSFFPLIYDLKKFGNNLFMIEQMYAFKSTDCGLNWTRMMGGGLPSSFYQVLGAMGNNIYIGNGTYAFKSTNNGVNWTNTLIPARHMLIRSDSIIIAGASQYPVRLSTNNLINYTNISRELENKTVNYLYSHKNTVYAAVAGYGIYKHSFGGFVNITNTSNIIPDKFVLHQNYPNPFNPTTKIKFELPEQSYVTLKIYNLLGQKISILVNQNLNAGNYELEWNAGDLNSGIYFYKLESFDYTETKKMLLVK